MNSIPGKSRTTNMVFAVCAQRVSSDIVPDIDGARGGKIASTQLVGAASRLLPYRAQRFWGQES
jgi:hypothetical protein